MTEFNNDVMHRLVDEFQLEQGETGPSGTKDFYVHKQSGKPLLTKRGVNKIKEARKFRHETPSLQDVAGRVVVSGWWIDDKNELKVWTTGEANPGARAVEASHPASIAEKRWKTRGIIALECGEGAGVYGEDEFNDAFFDKADRKQKPAPAAKKEPEVPKWALKLPEDWDIQCAAICELAGVERSTFDNDLFVHCTKFWSDSATKFITPQARSLADLVHEGKNPGRWGVTAIKAAKEVVAELKNGNPARLVIVNGTDGQGINGVTLNPTASSASPKGSAAPSVLDQPGTPY
jgi:hypothetical protein